MDQQAREKSWQDWLRYSSLAGFDPWLRTQPKAIKQNLLLAFAARVRTGIFGLGKRVGFQSVEKALRHVAQTLVLAGYDDPRRTYGSKELDLPFQRLLAQYRKEDPPPQPQVALPVATVQYAAGQCHGQNSALRKATADLIATAFFFLLRVGEYSMPQKNTKTRTVQFRVKDVTFRDLRGHTIPHHATLQQLQNAVSVTLFLDNQKNGQRGATIFHTACPTWFCPVKALARRVHSIISLGKADDTPLSFVGPNSHVTARHVTLMVHEAARATELVSLGYKIKRIGTHSLRASGAMALKLQGISDSTIMKIGRWTGLTFLTYIHSQIGALNVGLATRMTQRIEFLNVGG